MSDDITTDFTQVDNNEDSTIIRFPMSPEDANKLLRDLQKPTLPDASMVDEIHILISPEAIKRTYDSFPIPDELRAA